MPQSKVYSLPIDVTGQSVSEKLAAVRGAIRENKVSGMVVTALDEVAWLFNLRVRNRYGRRLPCLVPIESLPLLVPLVAVLPTIASSHAHPRRKCDAVEELELRGEGLSACGVYHAQRRR